MIWYFGSEDLVNQEEDLDAGIIPEAMDFLMVPIISNMDPTACPEGRQLLIVAADGTRKPRYDTSEDRKKWKKGMHGIHRENWLRTAS
jgi:phytoene dehydrogenase-like protein